MSETNISPESMGVGRALIVDDDAGSRLIMRDVLRANGHGIMEAENAEQALRSVRAQPPDVILLDAMMPGMDGFTLCGQLKRDRATAHIPVLMVTSRTDRADRLRGIAAGANDFLAKPVDPEEVALRVRNAVYGKKLFDEVQEQYRRLRDMRKLNDNVASLLATDTRLLSALLPAEPPPGNPPAGSAPTP
jgi:DNA-binding response OmpR family regulator